MAVINKITQKTDNRFVNLYDLDVTHKNGEASHYYVASRARSEKELKIRTGENHPDGVIIYSIYGPDKDKVVLIRQYRYPIGGYVYEFPAGLVERGEDYREAAIREMHEETGLTFTTARRRSVRCTRRPASLSHPSKWILCMRNPALRLSE